MQMQDALIELVRAEETLEATRRMARFSDDVAEDAQRLLWSQEEEIVREVAIAKRLVRFQAARVGDPKLWEMVIQPPAIIVGQVINVSVGPGDPDDPPDRYDRWNARIRELFQEL